MSNGPFSEYPTAEWSVEGTTVWFAVERLTERKVNRLIRHKRVYRDGARLDDTFQEAIEWTAVCLFFNDEEQEGGIDGATQYPDNLNEMCDSFDIHETGNLILPTRGPRRCRAESYERIESWDVRNAAAVTFVWVEDNEDDGEAAAFTAPSAKSQNLSVIEAVDFAFDIGGGDSGNLNDLASDVQGLAEAPGDYASQVEGQVNAVSNKAKIVEESVTKATHEAKSEAETLFTDPEQARGVRALRKLRDNTAQILEDLAASTRPTITVTFPVVVAISDVAAKFSQTVEELSKLNGSLEDLLAIPIDTPVTVYAA